MNEALEMPKAEEMMMVVRILFNSIDEEQRGKANAWLMHFARTAAAWEACCLVLQNEADEQAKVFAANLLFNKVRSEWHGLPIEAQASVFGAIRRLVFQLAGTSAPDSWPHMGLFGKRLCLAFAAAAVRSGCAVRCALEALSMSARPDGCGLATAIELLTALPQALYAFAHCPW